MIFEMTIKYDFSKIKKIVFDEVVSEQTFLQTKTKF